jgi:hypothetical protein
MRLMRLIAMCKSNKLLIFRYSRISRFNPLRAREGRDYGQKVSLSVSDVGFTLRDYIQLTTREKAA